MHRAGTDGWNAVVSACFAISSPVSGGICVRAELELGHAKWQVNAALVNMGLEPNGLPAAVCYV